MKAVRAIRGHILPANLSEVQQVTYLPMQSLFWVGFWHCFMVHCGCTRHLVRFLFVCTALHTRFQFWMCVRLQ